MSNDLILFGNFFDFFDEIFHSDNWFNVAFPATAADTTVPTNMKIKENRDIEITMAIAGYPKENVDIDFDGDYLTVILNKVEKKETEKERYACKGIKSSYAKQKFAIPVSKYDQEKARAHLKDGLLIVTIPSKEEIKPRKVNINVD